MSISEGAIKSAIQFIYLTIGRPDFYGFVATFSSMYHLFLLWKLGTDWVFIAKWAWNKHSWVKARCWRWILVFVGEIYMSIRVCGILQHPGHPSAVVYRAEGGVLGWWVNPMNGNESQKKKPKRPRILVLIYHDFLSIFIVLVWFSMYIYIMYIVYVLVVSWGTGGKHVVGSCSSSQPLNIDDFRWFSGPPF